MQIYKICTREMWEETQRTGVFPGMPIDIADGYIHFSTAEQQAETTRKYFAGQSDLVLLTVDAESLGDHLRWEPSSSGARAGKFPHLYGQLTAASVMEAVPFFIPLHSADALEQPTKAMSR
jgi:uncharacterized protein (DUF952 family)